jgi:dTDP-4-dehydrorhamnose reductase
LGGGAHGAGVWQTYVGPAKPADQRGAGIKKGETLKIFNDQMRTPTYVEDLATALAKMIDKKSTGIFHISGKDVLTPYQMAVAAAEHEGLDAAKSLP